MSSDTSNIYFFGHDNHVPYDFLSQHYISPFEHDGVTYHTAEMRMIVHKATLFGDEDIAKQMLETNNARKHKALGRKVQGFDGVIWDEHKDRIVEEGSLWKFSSNEALKKKLLETGERMLVEASPYDRIWGIGVSKADAKDNKANWGENRLEKALMKVRAQLKEQEAS